MYHSNHYHTTDILGSGIYSALYVVHRQREERIIEDRMLSRECLYVVLMLVGKGLTCQIDAGMSKTGPERGWLTKLTRLQLIPSM
jgi:hypothetical protein